MLLVHQRDQFLIHRVIRESLSEVDGLVFIGQSAGITGRWGRDSTEGARDASAELTPVVSEKIVPIGNFPLLIVGMGS